VWYSVHCYKMRGTLKSTHQVGVFLVALTFSLCCCLCGPVEVDGGGTLPSNDTLPKSLSGAESGVGALANTVESSTASRALSRAVVSELMRPADGNAHSDVTESMKPPPPDEFASSNRYDGVLVGPDGRPLGGVRATIFIIAFYESGAQNALVRYFRTGVRGTFSVIVPRNDAANTRSAVLRVGKGTSQLASDPIPVPSVPGHCHLGMVLVRGPDLFTRGRVTYDDGRPVANAIIRVMRDSNLLGVGAHPDFNSGYRANRDGIFEIRRFGELMDCSPILLYAEADGFRGCVPFGPSEREPVIVMIESHRVIRGSLRTGALPVDARHFRVSATPLTAVGCRPIARAWKLASDGSFALYPLDLGEYELFLESDLLAVPIALSRDPVWAEDPRLTNPAAIVWDVPELIEATLDVYDSFGTRAPYYVFSASGMFLKSYATQLQLLVPRAGQKLTISPFNALSQDVFVSPGANSVVIH